MASDNAPGAHESAPSGEPSRPSGAPMQSRPDYDRYLTANGWRRFGIGATAVYKDPTRPFKTEYKKTYPKRIHRDPETGDTSEDPIMVQTGQPGGRKPCEQVQVTHKWTPMGFEEAVRVQQLRDAEKEEQTATAIGDREDKAKKPK